MSSSRNRRVLCLLIYMLQRANAKKAIAKITVVILLSKSDSAVTSIVMRLVSCRASSSFALIAVWFFIC